jgi:signal transduction histidine kinase
MGNTATALNEPAVVDRTTDGPFPGTVRSVSDLADGVGMAVVATDLGGNVRHANPEALRLLEPGGQGCPGLSPAAGTFFGLTVDSQPDLASLERFLRGSTGKGAGSVTISGSGRHLVWSGRIVGGEDEHGPGRVFLIRDATAERQYEQLKTDFLATLSHELRTPLTSLRGSLQLVVGRGEGLGAMDRQLLEIGINNSERLIRLVNDLLDIDALERERLSVRLTSVDVQALLRPAVDAVSALAGRRGISIEVICPGDLPRVNADRDRLLQVLINLLTNAVTFGPVGSVVTVRARRRRAGLQIDVSDQGPGIPAEQQLQVYERFWRADRNGADAGAGLGLAICRAVVARHGGEIWLDSEVGRGSVFSFSLPEPRTAEGAGTPMPDGGCEGDPGGVAGGRILLVEDDPDTRAILRTSLEEWGYEVTEAPTGAQAVAAARRERPAAVVLDLILPDIDGYDVLRIFKNSPDMAQVPVLVLSIESERELARRLGAAEVLQKPLDLNAVRRCLSSGLGG